ncbi:MAG: GspE/PulE family protein [Burkholderiaceae bacterium]|nr:GspE/PulE family protein [Burkholderiaceae bacterium]
MGQAIPSALFFRALQHLSNRIHNTERIEQIMLDLAQPICNLFGADRITIYTVAEDGSYIVSRVKTGLQTIRSIRLRINNNSVAGYVALKRQLVNVADAHDAAALQQIAPDLNFQPEVDRRSGYLTRQLLTAPIVQDGTLYGVLQLINTRNGAPFSSAAEQGVTELCQTLAIAFKHRGLPLGLQALSEAEPVAESVAEPVALAATDPRPASPPPGSMRYQWLVQQGHITAPDLAQCLQQAREVGLPGEAMLLQQGVAVAAMGASLAAFFGVPYVGFEPQRLRIESLHGALKREFLLAQGWVPLEEGHSGLQVMCLDPEAVRSARIVGQVFPQVHPIDYVVTTQQEFLQTLDQLYPSQTDTSVDRMLADLSDITPDDTVDDSALVSAAADNELVKLVNRIILDAYQQGASDIHIEPLPGKEKTQIRFRIDGGLRPYIEIPAAYRAPLVTRIKIMCDLDISERRKPQDGKIQFRRFGPLDIELRVATIASMGGVEDVVLRLLRGGEPLPLEQLNLSAHNLQRLIGTITKPYGLFYVCGPTGSGKTTTLHSILKHLNTPDTKIWTAEDPVEITQRGLRQVQINKKAGVDFATVMRAFLRLDPDIIMVGESRDLETVSMGIEASLTGHLVFSTLHTNSAPESIVRLLDMGMDPFNFADALLGVLAQRLARKLCSCKQSYLPDEAELAACANEYLHTSTEVQPEPQQCEALLQSWRSQYGDAQGQLQLYRPVGCDKCQGSGYKGRVALHELLVADDAIKEHIQLRSRVAQLLQSCLASGMRTLKMDGIEKALQGLTDLRQVRLVCIK